MWFSRSPSYTGLSSDDDEKPSKPEPRTQISLKNGLFASLFFAAGIASVLIAQTISNSSHSGHALELDTIPHTFHYNRSFSYPPSNHTNRAWRNIFPAEGGFFIHPTIAPTRSTFSVFHQLHCLNGLRGGYWANHHAALHGHRLKDEDLPVDIQESHMRHCIDLLRQALMCHGDTTLEVVDEAINGVHGFRVEHQCKDWAQLKAWTSEQQARQSVEQIV
ncbi:MAG: hypothetical protein Q9195_007489 [Heterodermia aff. obscurata]